MRVTVHDMALGHTQYAVFYFHYNNLILTHIFMLLL